MSRQRAWLFREVSHAMTEATKETPMPEATVPKTEEQNSKSGTLSDWKDFIQRFGFVTVFACVVTYAGWRWIDAQTAAQIMLIESQTALTKAQAKALDDAETRTKDNRRSKRKLPQLKGHW
jgi:hypothetical protein